MEFLSLFLDSSVGFSSINTTKSAVSLILDNVDSYSIGSHPMVCRFLKGIGRIRPPRTKYDFIWNPSKVFSFLENLGSLETLSLMQLSVKCATLLALCTGHRIQTLSVIKLEEIVDADDKIIIYISERIKTSNPGRIPPSLVLQKFLPRPGICPVTTLRFYMHKTESFRPSNCKQLFISCKQPHKPVGRSTISNWIKKCLHDSGIDMNMFTAYSCRHVSTSVAYKNGNPVDEIRKRASWSNESATFARFYNRPIDCSTDFCNAVLSG